MGTEQEVEPLLRFPVADLLQFIADRAAAEGSSEWQWIARHFGPRGSFRRQFDRMKENPDGLMRWTKADEYAGKLGVNPSAIWPEWFAHAVPENQSELGV